MKSRVRAFPRWAVVAFAIAASIFLGFWAGGLGTGFLNGGSSPVENSGPQSAAVPPRPAAAAAAAAADDDDDDDDDDDASGVAAPSAAPTGGELLHTWLTSSQDVHEIAETILRGWPKLQAEDHAMAVKELIPLVTDDRYHGLRTLLLDPKTSVEAKELLFKNLILRPKDLHLPLFLTVLRQSPRHPCADDARNQLYVRFGEDYGTDWTKWQARINEELSP